MTCYLVHNYWRFGWNMLLQHAVFNVNISSESIPVATRFKAWVCGVNSRRRHWCLSLVRVLCFNAEVSDSGWSLIQRSSTECGVSGCDREALIMKRPWPTRGWWGMGETKRALDISVTLLSLYKRVGTLIVATIYLQLIQNRYMFRSFTVLQCSHLHCVQPVASDVEVVGYL